MALLDTLRDRTGFRGGSAQVDCGELGTLTVEALPPADCFQLSGDSRALLYAACRELQLAGEALRQEGKLFRPDEITAYLSADEADEAARTVLKLSGVPSDGGAMSEIRHESVQTFLGAEAAIRPASVQADAPSGGAVPAFSGGSLWAGEAEIRLPSVQADAAALTENGQVSREFSGDGGDFRLESTADKKAQILGPTMGRTAQIVPGSVGKAHPVPTAEAAVLHEIGSEYGMGGSPQMHETESESRGYERGILHETASEFGRSGLRKLHETTSESGGRAGRALHESESESQWILHEVRSELRKAMHEIKSEVKEMMHESKSELAEEAARRLAEGIIRAAGVR